MIYLAVPYSGTPKEQEWRFVCANHVAGAILNMGIDVFSPISQTHPIAQQCGLEGTWERWSSYDEKVLARLCDGVYVLMLEGWKESTGVQAEIDIAVKLNKRVEFINPKDFGVDEAFKTIEAKSFVLDRILDIMSSVANVGEDE